VGHPFDLVKVRMQTAEKGVYSGAMDVVRKTIAKEGMARVRSGRHKIERPGRYC
jgi:solute carrier family 25 carnitine/acylcarnitine transporter 20/29